MAAARNSRTTDPSQNGGFGLLAIGTCEPWEVAIDEVTSGADRWIAQMDGPSVTFRFEIPSLDIVEKMVKFLERSMTDVERNGSLVIGKDQRNPVTLVRDDEYDDRFFLVVGPTANPMVRLVVAGLDVANLVGALRQVKDDLDEED